MSLPQWAAGGLLLGGSELPWLCVGSGCAGGRGSPVHVLVLGVPAGFCQHVSNCSFQQQERQQGRCVARGAHVGTFSSCSVLRKMEKSTAADVAVYRMLSCSLIVIPLPQSKILKSLCYLYSQCDCRKVGLASTSQPPSLGSDKQAAHIASPVTAPPPPWVPLPPQLLLTATSQLCSAGGAALPDGRSATCITALL